MFCKFTKELLKNTVFPHVVSALEYFPQQKLSLLIRKLKYCDHREKKETDVLNFYTPNSYFRILT